MAMLSSQGSLLPKKPPHLTSDGLLTGLRQRMPSEVKWTPHERERFQRVLLTYGFPRPALIKKIANLTQHTEAMIEDYTDAFMIQLCRYLSGDEKTYLQRVTREIKDPATKTHPTLVGWDKMQRSANVWGRRLCNLHFLGELARSPNDILSLIPTSFFSGPRPTAWWGRNDDKGLLKGTFKHGYARYDHIKADGTLGFTSSEAKANTAHKPGSAATTNGWPSADVLTRRLKRLIDVSRKNWRKKRPLMPAKAGVGRTGETRQEQPHFKRRKLPDMNDNDAKQYLNKRKSKASGRFWKYAERRMLTKALMTHPIHIDASGRPIMEKIKKSAGMDEYPDKDVASLAFCILWELCIFLSDRQKKRSFEGGPLFLPILKWEQSELRGLADRVPILSRIAKSAHHPQLVLTLMARAPPPVQGTLPVWWQRVTHDIALIKGISKHGYDSWEKILSDSELNWMPDSKQAGFQAVDDDLSMFMFVKDPNHAKNLEIREKKSIIKQPAPHPYPTSGGLVARLNQLLPVLNLLHHVTGGPSPSPTAKKDTSKAVMLPADTVSSFLVHPHPPPLLGGETSSSANWKSWNQGFVLKENIPTNISVSTAQMQARGKRGLLMERNAIKIIYRDEDGKITFPMRIADDLCLYAIGKYPPEDQVDRYHTQDFIFFPGYVSVREHQSMVNPEHFCKYKCEVLAVDDSGREGPWFRVTCEDSPSEPILKSDADDAWQEVSNAIYLVSNAPLSDRKQKLNGYERFGFCDEAVVAIVQESTGHLKCSKYEPIAVGVTNFVK
eukprot:CAMPEP_0167742564 /NCGR_PEP_ID=MMETSP0110_2-20121227/1506_1 /TAXON_ID=629695 /ORGANISM="Gymnochlora sp., Strain CCMP2014" /LENGTH=780 /DNA_ID=CAMNT_0007626789 /DNA_START=318 /DNA_END=2660 /DNA_ORIENTATION=+